MNRLLSGLAIISIVSIALLSCKGEEKKNLNEDNYQPGPDWKLAWSDEFDADAIDINNWNFQVEEAGRFNDEWQRYTNSSNNAYIDNDCLVIKAIHESDVHGMDQYTSARLNTANKQAWKYGKIAARMKLPHGNGLWPAFWMLGANIDENGGDTPWPQSGEIDILELYGSKDDAVIESNVHYANSSDSHAMMGAVSFKLEEGTFADSFHIFELEWDSNKIVWFVDGEQFASMPISADELSEFHKEFFAILNIAVGGTHAGRPDSTTSFPQFMYVDWIRVYEKKEEDSMNDGTVIQATAFDSLVWSDEFDGDGKVNPQKWFHQTKIPPGGSWWGGLIQHYTDREENTYLKDGFLHIVAKKETFDDQGVIKQYTSARLNSKFAFTYGRVEVRAKLTSGVGTWPAIWMLSKNINEDGAYWENQGFGTTNWPNCGEIDIMEYWGKKPNYVQSAVHTGSSSGYKVINLGGQEVVDASNQFHLYSIQWSEEKIVFGVDGVTHYEYNPSTKNTDTWPFDSDQYVLMNIAIEQDIDSTFTESSMEVDYIRIFQ